MKKKNIIILGSTGSIGKNTLSILRKNRQRFKVLGVSAFSNISLLKKQIEEFKPRYVAVGNEKKVDKLSSEIKGRCRILAGPEGISELASKKSDAVVLGITGLSALRPLLSCLNNSKRLLLANKEAVISGGSLLMRKMENSKTEVFPVDSEAWGIYRLIKKFSEDSIRKVYITASGGPFWNKSKKYIEGVGIKEVLSHPVWNMGKRISVNSANLMNKGFEVIEIHNLFNLPVEKIGVLIHPQSSVHAFAETEEGVLFPCMFKADMRIPISYGLNYPFHIGIAKKALSLGKEKDLSFIKPDYKKFPALSLAYKVAKKGGNYFTILTSADEEAVGLFLKGKLKFKDIYNIVNWVIKKAKHCSLKKVEDVFFWDRWAKDKIRELTG